MLVREEIRSYGDDDHLKQLELRSSTGSSCGGIYERQTFDEQGRVLSLDGWTCTSPSEGPADFSLTYSYKEDGAVEVDLLDFVNDTPNDEVVVDGNKVSATTYHETRTKECAEIAVTARAQELRCAVTDR
jgi:hypothetical protein